MNLRHPPLVTVLTLLVLSCAATAASAEVRDGAGFFSEDAVRQANFDLREIKKQHGKDLLIETHASIPTNLQPQLTELGEDAFYEKWAVQSAQQAKIDGAAVLITKEPSHLHIVVGDKTRQKAFTTRDRDALRDQLLASFRAKQFDQGLQSAVRTFRDSLNANLGGAAVASVERPQGSTGAAAGGAANSSNAPRANPGAFDPRASRDATNPPAGRERSGGGFSIWKLVIWGIIIFVLVKVVTRLFARRNAQQHQGPGGMFGRPGGFNRTGYGQPGYDPRHQGGAMGGGFGTGLGGGLLGGLLGGWLGGRMMGGGMFGGGSAQGAPPPAAGQEPGAFSSEHDSQFAGSGGSFGDGGGGGDFGGGDSGGGGDF